MLPCLETYNKSFKDRLHIGAEDGQLRLEENVPVVPDQLQGEIYVLRLSNPGFDVLPSVSCLADNAS